MNKSPLQRIVLLCLSIGLILLLAACSTTDNTSTTTTSTTAKTSTNNTSKATPTTPPTATPADQGGVTPSDGNFKLELSCGGAKGDGFTVTDQHAKACAKAAPGAKLTIQVDFCNGQRDNSKELQGTFTANASGSYVWEWTPQVSGCKASTAWHVVLKAQTANGTSTVDDSGSSS